MDKGWFAVDERVDERVDGGGLPLPRKNPKSRGSGLPRPVGEPVSSKSALPSLPVPSKRVEAVPAGEKPKKAKKVTVPRKTGERADVLGGSTSGLGVGRGKLAPHNPERVQRNLELAGKAKLQVSERYVPVGVRGVSREVTVVEDGETVTPVPTSERRWVGASLSDAPGAHNANEDARPEPGMASGEWTEEKLAAVPGGGKPSKETRKAGSSLRVMPRDVEIVRLLARFRYGNDVQVARYVGASPKSVVQRLRRLAKAGFLRQDKITHGQILWTPTSAGMSMADVDFRPISEGGISMVTMAHTLGVLNVAVELETGQDNVLSFDPWPTINRRDALGRKVQGETLISEREVKTAIGRWNYDSMLANQSVDSLFGAQYSEWEQGGRQGLSPELIPGNEGFFQVQGHLPDLVVARPRAADGSPRSVAVEMELSPKPVDEWRRVLSLFRMSNIYDRVVYFTHKRNIAAGLTRVATELELGERFEVKHYEPRNQSLPFWG